MSKPLSSIDYICCKLRRHDEEEIALDLETLNAMQLSKINELEESCNVLEKSLEKACYYLESKDDVLKFVINNGVGAGYKSLKRDKWKNKIMKEVQDEN